MGGLKDRPTGNRHIVGRSFRPSIGATILNFILCLLGVKILLSQPQLNSSKHAMVGEVVVYQLQLLSQLIGFMIWFRTFVHQKEYVCETEENF